MKRTFILLYFIFTNICLGQYACDLDQGNADYPVPEPLAFHSLLENSSFILFPSSVRSLVVSSGIIESRDLRVNVVGVELAPFFMFKAFNLSHYLSGRLFRLAVRTRISLAATTISNNGFRGSAGLRWMLHDDEDIRADSLFQKSLYELGSGIAELKLKCAEISSKADSYTCYTEGVSQLQLQQAKIDSVREMMKHLLWNRSAFELGVTSTYSSDIHNLTGESIQQFNLYLNAALPMGTSGQKIFGINGKIGRESSGLQYERAISLIGLLALGNPSTRGYTEIRYRASNLFPFDIRPGVGASFHLLNGLGVQIDISISALKEVWKSGEGFLILSLGTPEIRL